MPFQSTRLVGPTTLTTSASSALYTVATGYSVIIKQIVVTNTTSNQRTFTLYVGASASSSTAIFSGTQVAANDSMIINISQVLNSGDKIFALADAGSALNLTISGVVNDGPLTPNATYIADNQVTTNKIADSAITTAKIANNAIIQSDLSTSIPLSGMRNLIINGNMRINQRNTAITSGSKQYTVDRWYVDTYDSGFRSTAQSTDVPTGSGFTHSLMMTSVTGNTSSNMIRIGQVIEDVNCAQLAYGTAGAKTITVSFWVKATVAGTYGLRLFTGYAYLAPFTVNTSNTWEYKTITIPGDTANTITASHMELQFTVHASALYWGTSNSWVSSTMAYATANQVNAMATTGNVFGITGVQVEIGSQATPFEQRHYGTELALCQRYFTTRTDKDNTGGASGTSLLVARFKFDTQMRSAPTATIMTAGSFIVGNDFSANYTASTVTLSAYQGGPSVTRTALGGFASYPGNGVFVAQSDASGTAVLAFSSEL